MLVPLKIERHVNLVSPWNSEQEKSLCYGNVIHLPVRNPVEQEMAEQIQFAEGSIKVNCNYQKM